MRDRLANRRAHEEYIAALAEERWARWEAGIEARDDRAIGALHRLLEAMAKQRVREEPTARELQVLQLVANGGIRRTIADTLGISPETVHTLLQNVRMRLGARNSTHAVTLAWRRGLIE